MVQPNAVIAHNDVVRIIGSLVLKMGGIATISRTELENIISVSIVEQEDRKAFVVTVKNALDIKLLDKMEGL